MIADPGPDGAGMARGLIAIDPGELGYYFAAPIEHHGRPAIVSRTGYTGEDGL